MHDYREEFHTGLDALREVTTLQQRIRGAHPTAGLYEAADFQWWWGQRPRSTDSVPQLFWFDDVGPVAAIVLTESGEQIQLDPLVMPAAAADWVARVIERGLKHAAASGIGSVTLEVNQEDDALRDILTAHGFSIEEDGLVETWLAAGDRPPISHLAAGYRLSSRAESSTPEHHMTTVKRGHEETDARLRQTSLYRPDLDLVVHDSDGTIAAYGLFWYDPVTATGLVEPMRTQQDHQRLGLARHILTAGLERMAEAGAERIKVCYEPDNPASGHLYRSVGFVPDRETIIFSGQTAAGAVG